MFERQGSQHQRDGRFLLAFEAAIDALRFCHAAQMLLMYTQWPPESAGYCGAAVSAGGPCSRASPTPPPTPWAHTRRTALAARQPPLRLHCRRCSPRKLQRQRQPQPGAARFAQRAHAHRRRRTTHTCTCRPPCPQLPSPDGRWVFQGPRMAMAVHDGADYQAVAQEAQHPVPEEAVSYSGPGALGA
jgi:hypothetical protein